jgi:hypothetical protein
MKRINIDQLLAAKDQKAKKVKRVKNILPIGTPKDLSDSFYKYKDSLYKYPNVITVGIGYKIVAGQIVKPQIYTITVHVTNKIKNLAAKDCIPLVLNGIQTDVIEHSKLAPA